MVPAPELDDHPPSAPLAEDDAAATAVHRKPPPSGDEAADPSSLSAAEQAALEALTATLRVCHAHLGGSSIGKGFRRAARYHLHRRAPQALPALLCAGGGTARGAGPPPAWDAAALEEGVCPVVEDPFYVVDLGVVAAQLARWRAAFPRVVPYYAVKCNPDPAIVRTLMSLGCHFDCASRAEIELVQRVAASLADHGLPAPPDIVYANPTKARGHVIDAVCRGVRRMTFDNAAEVRKLAAVSRKIQLILRIITDDSGSQCRLSSKFGAPPSHWPALLGEARRCGMEVVGASFHVGSGCRDATRYALALRDCKRLFALARRDFGYRMTVLDIGGGFPGETHSLWNPAKVRGRPCAGLVVARRSLTPAAASRATPLSTFGLQAFGDPTATEREPPKKPAVLASLPSIIWEADEGGNGRGADDDDNDDDDDGAGDGDDLEGKEPEEKSSQEDKERQYMYFR